MKIFFFLLSILSFPLFADVWKLEYSAMLRKHAPGIPQYAEETFSSKEECEKAVDAALADQKQTHMRTHYNCFLASEGQAKETAPKPSLTGHLNKNEKAALKFGTALVKGFFSPEEIGQNIPGQDNYKEFGGNKPDALNRHKDQFGFIAATPSADISYVKPHQLPEKNSEKVCGQMKQLSCYSTRGFIACCPKGYSYVAAPTGMAALGTICATSSADSSNQECYCFRDNNDCMNSKTGFCYGCSEL